MQTTLYFFQSPLLGYQDVKYFVYTYSNKWDIKVNIEKKKKILLFSKRGKSRDADKMFYNGEELDIVDRINYLANYLTIL